MGAGFLIDPEEKIDHNKYYDDSLWDDGLPPESTMTHNHLGDRSWNL